MGIGILTITAEQITTYANLALVAFVALAGLGFLFGVIKGLWKKSFSFTYYLVCFILLIFLVKPLAGQLFNFDLTSVNISIEGLDPNNPTLGGLLEKILTDFFIENDIAEAPTAELVLYVEGLALSIIQFVLYIVGMMLIMLLGGILCPLLYHVAFKWFIPKRLRKHKKMRLLGGLIGSLEMLMVFCLTLTPFTAVINSIVASVRDEDGNIIKNEENTDELYQLITNVLEGYNNSILANALFTLKVDGKTIDVAIMDYVTESNISEDQKLHFYQELGNIGSIVIDAISTGAFNSAEQTIDTTLLVNSDFIKNTFYTLSDSSMITVALPIVASLAFQLVPSDMGIDLSNIDLTGVDWSDSLKCVGDVFDSIKETGYIELAMDNPEGMMNEIYLNRENEVHLKNALTRFGDSTLIKTLMPQLIVSYLEAQKTTDEVAMKNKLRSAEESEEPNMLDGLFNDLPEQAYLVETYQDINWGTEMANMLEIVLKVSDQVKSVRGEDISLADVATIFEGPIIQEALLGINENGDYTTSDVYSKNVYLNGGEVNGVSFAGTKAILGCYENSDNVGLLDLQIIDKIFVDFNLLSRFVPVIFNALGDDLLGDTTEIEEDLDEEISSWKIADWKNEFASLLELAVPLLKTVEIISESSDIVDGLISKEGETAIVYFSDHLKDSYLMNNLVPEIAQAYVSKEENDMDIIFGLSLSDFNFNTFSEDTSFGEQFKYLATDLLPRAADVLDSMSDGAIGLDTVIDNPDVYADLLKVMYQSEIVNKPLTDEERANGGISNFENIMIGLFSELTDEDIENGMSYETNIPHMTDNIIVFERDTILGIGDDWIKENGSGEIDALFNVIRSIKDENSESNILYSYLKDRSLVNLDEEIYSMGPEVERIFASVDESVLMKEAFPGTLNQMFKDTPISSAVDFGKVEDWESEGVAFGSVLNSIDELLGDDTSKDIVDVIKNCDNDAGVVKEYQFNSVDTQEMYNKYQGNYDEYFYNESKSYRLLQDIESTQSINMQDLLYTTLEDSLGDMVDEEIFNDAESDFKFAERTRIYSKINDKDYYVSWACDENVKDEIGYYGETYSFARLLGYADSLSNASDLPTEQMNDLLTICVESYPLRKLIGPIISDTMDDVKANSSSGMVGNIITACDFDAFDYLVFENDRELEIEKRLVEVDAICEVYDQKDSLADINSDFENKVKELTNIESDGDSNLTRMLNKMHRSEIFNSSRYIAEEDESDNRIKLTSFETIFQEIFKMKEDVFVPLENDEIYALNNRLPSDLWTGENGEIMNFNNSINKTLGSKLYQEVVANNNGDLYATLKELYTEEDNDHIEELADGLQESILLEKQLPNIFDKNIYGSLKDNLSSTKTDNDYQMVDNAYTKYNQLFKDVIMWDLEGQAFDSLMYTMSKANIDLDNPSRVKSADIQSILNALDSSYVLKYASRNIDLDENISDAKERSFNEYLICAFETYIIDEIYDPSKNLFEIEDPENQKQFINTSDIDDYDLEELVIIHFLEVDESLTKVDNDGFTFVGEDDSFKFGSFNELKKEKLLEFADILDKLYHTLGESHVFNFKIIDNGTSEDNIKEGSYLNRTTYEHSLIHLSKQIRKSLVDSFELEESKGYVINDNSHNLLNKISQFDEEEPILIQIVKEYTNVLDVFKQDISVSKVAENKQVIKTIIETIGESKILNHTLNDKVAGDLSIYDDVVLYLSNRVNSSILDSLSLTNDSASINNIKNNLILASDSDYQYELDLILDDGGIIDISNKMDFENSSANFSISELNNESSPFHKNKVISLLETIFDSKIMNYTNEDHKGRINYEVSTFEEVLIKIFAQETYASKILDLENELQGTKVEFSKYRESGNYLEGGKDVVASKIREINDGVNDGDSLEGTYLTNVHFFTQGETLGEINKLFNLFTTINNNQEMDFGNIETGASFLKEIGKIYILHDIVPSQIRELTENESIDNGETSSDIKIHKISDLEIINEPSFYHYEYSLVDLNVVEKYSYFEECASDYENELDVICTMVTDAKEANKYFGDITSLADEDTTIFSTLLGDMANSNIYRSIGPDTITMIFSQMSIINPINSTKYDMAYFIDMNDSGSEEINLINRATVVQENFDNFANVDNCYKLEGVSLDKFLDHAIDLVNLSATTLAYDQLYIGYHMANNLDSIFDF